MKNSSPAYLPDRDKLSVVTATLVAALLGGYFVRLPDWEVVLRLPGFLLPLHFSATRAFAVLIAALTAAGTDWVLGDHPALGNRPTWPHWLLPALTAWVLEVLLQRLPLGALWWVTLALGLIIWFLVLVAEYIVVDAEDLRYPLAAAGLTGLGFLLFFLLAVAVRAAGWRLFFTAPTLGVASGIVALRTFNLQRHGEWRPIEAVFVAAITAQLAAALHYLPIPPLAYGLILVAAAYAATVYLANLMEEQSIAQALWEPVVTLAVLLLLLPWAW
ncbi:MAG: hypothetical protein GXO56_08480 [Chloroflexi bacterium]|nr:hypothetical protein [Chloroflexota bacterium]